MKMLVEAGKTESLSTVILICAEQPLSKEEAITAKERGKKASVLFTNAHKDKDLNLWRHVLCSGETKEELLGCNDDCYVWRRKGGACTPGNTIVTVKYGGGSIML